KEDISLVELERQLERYKYINFNYLKYKLFNSLIISIISFIGIICYVLFSVFSNRKIIGIKRALGYTRIKLLSEYVINVFLILTAGIVIVLGHKHKDELFKLSSDNIVLITLVVALVIASTIGIVLHYITKRNIADFVKGD
ncbi:MAG: FtsX-like permease family protein, partial [Sarcina sp.]